MVETYPYSENDNNHYLVIRDGRAILEIYAPSARAAKAIIANHLSCPGFRVTVIDVSYDLEQGHLSLIRIPPDLPIRRWGIWRWAKASRARTRAHTPAPAPGCAPGVSPQGRPGATPAPGAAPAPAPIAQGDQENPE